MEGFHFEFQGGFDVGFARKFKDTNGSLDFLLEIFVLGREGLLSTGRGTNCKLDAAERGMKESLARLSLIFSSLASDDLSFKYSKT
jgi:hypothetical protein